MKSLTSQPTLPAPSAEAVQRAFTSSYPDLAPGSTAELMAEGWDNWLFVLDDIVIRVPKRDGVGQKQLAEMRFLREFRERLPLATPDIRYVVHEGVNGQPMTGYEKLAGKFLSEAPPADAATTGARLGQFLRSLHAISGQQAEALGLDVFDHRSWWQKLDRDFDEFEGLYARHLAEEDVSFISNARAAVLDRDSEDSFQAAPIHSDLGPAHLLADADTGHLAAIIDFADICAGDVALDLTSVLSGELHNVLGVTGTNAFLAEYGPIPPEFHRMARFYRLLSPIYQVAHAVESADESLLKRASATIRSFRTGSQGLGLPPSGSP